MRLRFCEMMLFGSLLLTCPGLSVWAQTTPEKVVTVEGVTEYKFPNGARAVLFPEPSRQSISVNMTVLVGSRHEGYGEAGMAHLLEHLVFKGTPTFPEVPKALRDHGANFNGTTNVDRTNYFETLPSSDENLEFAIHLECDRLMNSYIKREDLMSEFTVVRNEFERGENSPQGVLSQRVQAVAYEWHNYGKSTIGNRSDIERVPINNLQDFYKKYYQPDNAVLILSGRFDEANAVAAIEKHFGALPRPTRKLQSTYTVEPTQDGERSVVLRRVGDVQLASPGLGEKVRKRGEQRALLLHRIDTICKEHEVKAFGGYELDKRVFVPTHVLGAGVLHTRILTKALVQPRSHSGVAVDGNDAFSLQARAEQRRQPLAGSDLENTGTLNTL